MSDFPLPVDPSDVGVASAFGADDHFLASVDGVLRRVTRDQALALFEGAELNPRVFNLGSRLAVQGFAASVPAIGTKAAHPGATYIYLGSGTPISDMPGWAPEDIVSPRHMGAAMDGATDDAAALQEADDYCASIEGKLLCIDGTLALASTVSLRARHIVVRGLIKPLSTFAADATGSVVRLGENTSASAGHYGRAMMELSFDGSDYCGKAAGTWAPSSGAFPAVGFNGAAVAAGDSFVPTGSGTVGGVAFTTSDRLVALVNNPSTTTYASNWVKRSALTMLHISGLALPFPRLVVDGRHCDTLVHVTGNSEKLLTDIGGWRCHHVLKEASDADGSPDNNIHFVRANQCGRVYSNSGSVVTTVWAEDQAQLQGYAYPPVDIRAARQTKLMGTLRAPAGTGIYVEQDGSIANTCVEFLGMSVVAPGSGIGPWLHIEGARMVKGAIHCAQPREGVLIRDTLGIDLNVTVDGQTAGHPWRLGKNDQTQTVRNGHFRFKAYGAGGLNPSYAHDIDHLVIEETGALSAGITVENHTRSRLVMPARAFDDGVTINRGSSGGIIELEYIGTDYGEVTQATSKSTAVTLNRLDGHITTHDESMAPGAIKTFTVNNSRVELGDHVDVSARSSVGRYTATLRSVAGGSFIVDLTNMAGTTRSDAVGITMKVRKGVRA